MMATQPTAFMREAIRLASENIARSSTGPFGAVVVKGGEIVGRGVNRVVVRCDPTAHAEIEAIRSACSELGTHSLEGCEIYSSCEPCAMCLAAIYWARLDRVTYGSSRTDAASAGFDDVFIYEEMARPPQERALALNRLLEDEAASVFDEWARKTGKLLY